MANTQPDPQKSQIAQFFAGKNIFVTGASGFIGKVLVEKLLRSCPDVNHIYILLRSKNGLTPKQRLEQQFVNCKVFAQLSPSLITEKIRPLDGQLNDPNLGICEESQKLLIDEVNVVFHVAASVRFDDPLKQCMRENVMGTKYVLELCHRLSRLEAFVHVSTAYAYCHLPKSEERLYPMKVKPSQMIDLCSWMDDASLEVGCTKLFEGRPNTYTFTKALAEHFIDQNRAQLPVAIARPSIVTASKQEPITGWIDSVNGPAGASLLGTLGIARTINYKPNSKADLIPVDTVANALIAIAWKTAQDPPVGKPLKVYNITTSDVNPTTWVKYLEYGRVIAMQMPSMRMVRVPAQVVHGDSVNQVYHKFTKFFSETLFAYFVDLILLVLGYKPLMIRLVRRMHNAFNMLEFFTNHEWIFPCDNLLKLTDSLSPVDQKLFDFDVRKIDWREYTYNMYIGIRRHLLKEDDENVHKAKKRFARLKMGYTIFNAVVVVALLFLCSRFIPSNYLQLVNMRS